MKRLAFLRSLLTQLGVGTMQRTSLGRLFREPFISEVDAIWGSSPSFIISGARYDSRPLNATKSNHLYCDLWERSEWEQTWNDWIDSKCREPCTLEACAVGRECNSSVGIAAVYSLVNVCGSTLGLGTGLPGFNIFFVSVHTLTFIHLDPKAHGPKFMNNTREHCHERWFTKFNCEFFNIQVLCIFEKSGVWDLLGQGLLMTGTTIFPSSHMDGGKLMMLKT